MSCDWFLVFMYSTLYLFHPYLLKGNHVLYTTVYFSSFLHYGLRWVKWRADFLLSGELCPICHLVRVQNIRDDEEVIYQQSPVLFAYIATSGKIFSLNEQRCRNGKSWFFHLFHHYFFAITNETITLRVWKEFLLFYVEGEDTVWHQSAWGWACAWKSLYITFGEQWTLQ